MVRLRFDFIEKRLATLLGQYAAHVTDWPLPFIIGPLLLTAVLVMGFVKNPPLLKDKLSLYTPSNAQARSELNDLKYYFALDDRDAYYVQRRYELERAGHAIVTTNPQGNNILERNVIEEAANLWSLIESITVTYSNHQYNYSTICVRVPFAGSELNHSGACISNSIVDTFKSLNKSPNSSRTLLSTIRYPKTLNGWFVGHLFGGVELNRAKIITESKALMLPYQLKHNTKDEEKIAELWETAFSDILVQFKSSVIDISWWTSETLAAESAKDRAKLLKLLAPLFVAVTAFTVMCCFVNNWILSRPWFGLGGVISAGLAILSSIGLLLLLNVQFTSVAYSMPFIVFSIGVDNVFILLASWRKTPPHLGLKERMSLTFKDAGVSITVTSLTDGLSFGVGCMTTFPSVRIFCLYATVAVIFVYVYQLTFFAGIMVLTGRREIDGKHCLTFKQDPKRKDRKQPSDGQNGVANGVKTKYWNNVHVNPYLSSDLSLEGNHALAKFFRYTYTDILLNPVVRILVISGFFIYLGFAIWGCTRIKLGLKAADLLPDNSYGRRTLKLQEQYFQEYTAFLHVWIRNLSSLQTADRRIWVGLQKEMTLYEHTEFTDESDSWLRTFLAFVKLAGLLLTPDNFVFILKNYFLRRAPYEKYSRDIVFDHSGLHLEAVRFPVYLRYVGNNNQSRAMHLFRRLAASSDLNVGVYSDFFQFAEQYDAVLPGTLTNIAVAGAAVIIVSLLLIPEPPAALWVSVTIASINVGILGYMSFWSVRLDFVSMVTIVMSIGFCVDFSAHLAYHFAKEKGKDVSERLRAALYAVGTPILQSAASTIIGVLFLILVDSYVYRSFLKTVILVILLGAFHGLVVLPVFLTLFTCNGDDAESEGEQTTSTAESPPDSRTTPNGSNLGAVSNQVPFDPYGIKHLNYDMHHQANHNPIASVQPSVPAGHLDQWDQFYSARGLAPNHIGYHRRYLDQSPYAINR